MFALPIPALRFLTLGLISLQNFALAGLCDDLANGQGSFPQRTFFHKEGLIDGFPILREDPNRSINYGVFFYKPGPEVRAVKILKRRKSDSSIEETLKNEVAGYKIGEKLGAPKLISFGYMQTHDEQKAYIEMEAFFFGQKYETLKNMEERGDFFRMNSEKIINRMAELFFMNILKRVVPRDPDFIVSAAGEVRWIDPSEWLFYGSATPMERVRFIDNLRWSHKAIQSYLARLSDGRLSDQFFNRVNQIIVGSNQLNAEEKRILLSPEEGGFYSVLK